MIVVIFEVQPFDQHRETYMDIAAALQSELEKIDGFVSVERFESLTTPGKLLSLSVFQDERAVAEWREVVEHRAAQMAGRSTFFKDYRLRVAGIIRDYGMSDRGEAPEGAPD